MGTFPRERPEKPALQQGAVSGNDENEYIKGWQDCLKINGLDKRGNPLPNGKGVMKAIEKFRSKFTQEELNEMFKEFGNDR